MIQDLDRLGQMTNFMLVALLVLVVLYALVVIPLWRCSFYLAEADKRALAAAHKAKKAEKDRETQGA